MRCHTPDLTITLAVFAFLTPPVAVVALIAAKLAEADYIKAAIEATKVAIGGFLIPFMFAYAPVLLFQRQELSSAMMAIVASVSCLLAFEISFVGYFSSKCDFFERFIALMSGISLFCFFILNKQLLFITGLSLLAFLILIQIHKKKGLIREAKD